MNNVFAVALALMLSACVSSPLQSTQATHEGLVEYAGSQKRIFETGKAEQTVSVAAMSACSDAFGVGAVAGLDGEITIIQGQPYVTQVRGDRYTVDQGHEHGAVFAVWTCQTKWRSEAVPDNVKGYLDLQDFVKTRAAAAGIDIMKPFPFRLVGSPTEVKWHVNVDLTGGKAIDSELFTKSKANYVARNQPMEIVGFYSEQHPGIFISAFAPAIPKESGLKNAIHIHMLTQDGKAAGHIDNIALAPGMTLLLPKP